MAGCQLPYGKLMRFLLVKINQYFFPCQAMFLTAVHSNCEEIFKHIYQFRNHLIIVNYFLSSNNQFTSNHQTH